ncbi:hypothetical protein GCM10023156_57250 [Novipirellula rosea]|uniref:Suppressor of fused-like domain-containing protein n=2 Tax=Novipirellula rosea TaxID=1031540 RepID=A0ABP8NKP8_9BACT
MKLDERRTLCKAISDKDNDAVRTFCREHQVPDYQEVKKKESLWLKYAIRNGNAEIVQTMLDHGLNVNPQVGELDQPPLTYAINDSKDDIVRLLLEHGADPNADRHLVNAINAKKPTERQLLYLQLLIKHGANVNQLHQLYDTDTQFTVLEWARDPVVREFLVRQGAKPSAELQLVTRSSESPGESPAKSLADRTKDTAVVVGQLSEVVDYFQNAFGKVDSKTFSDSLSIGLGVTVHVIKPQTPSEPITLFTTGLSAHPMNVPQETLNEAGYAELYMQLPGEWNIDDEAPQWTWPIQLILNLANHPTREGDYFLPPVTCVANESPLGPNVKFSSTALLALETFERSDGKLINCLCLMPIYEAEHRMIIEQGAPAFLKALDNAEVSRILDIDRPSVI